MAPKMVAGASEKVTRRLGRGGATLQHFRGRRATLWHPQEWRARLHLRQVEPQCEKPQPGVRQPAKSGRCSKPQPQDAGKLAMVSDVCPRLLLKRGKIVVQTFLTRTQVCHYLVKLFRGHCVNVRGGRT
ncbi:hypothetical protein KCU69_g35, partial [Aureobasidium melanogenum]